MILEFIPCICSTDAMLASATNSQSLTMLASATNSQSLTMLASATNNQSLTMLLVVVK